jgi:long-chain acyl-CoA synthetase
MQIDELLAQDFGTVAELIHAHALRDAAHTALFIDGKGLDYAALDAQMDRVAAALQREGLKAGDVVAISAGTSLGYATVFLGAVRAGVAVAPLAPDSTPEGLAAMVADSGARLFFVDQAVGQAAEGTPGVRRIALDDSDVGAPLSAWLAPAGAQPEPVQLHPEAPFNIIYSSGTTGTPKGIVQPHAMRWAHVARAEAGRYDAHSVALLATSLCSNTTLVCFFPALSRGGTVVLTEGRFDAGAYLAIAERERATHTMLVPVQYQRLMAHPDFDRFDLSAFSMKFCTSAPFAAALKADILARWPGGLMEYYGMTEGGGTCILAAHEFPAKLHTVGKPAEGHDIRLIDEDGREVAAGELGEVVGRSGSMMTRYHNQPAKTREAEWHDDQGRRYIRTGDVGRFDADGFLVLMDRRKDMVISGGFNIYPSDLEAVLRGHPGVADVAVVGVPSPEWGESPVAWVVPADGAPAPDALRAWANERLGKTQRLAGLRYLAELPRSDIGKVLKPAGTSAPH